MVGIGGGGKHPFHPGIRFPAVVEEQVTLPDGEHIRRCGLIAVQVRTAVEQQGELYLPGPVAEHLTHPVVFREDGGNNLQTVRVRSRLGLRGTTGEQSQDGEQAQSQGQHILFHKNSPCLMAGPRPALPAKDRKRPGVLPHGVPSGNLRQTS